MKYEAGDVVKIKVKKPVYDINSERVGIILHTTIIGCTPGYILLIAGIPNHYCYLCEEDIKEKCQ